VNQKKISLGPTPTPKKYLNSQFSFDLKLNSITVPGGLACTPTILVLRWVIEPVLILFTFSTALRIPPDFLFDIASLALH
jgi:hypothetical protein